MNKIEEILAIKELINTQYYHEALNALDDMIDDYKTLGKISNLFSDDNNRTDEDRDIWC